MATVEHSMWVTKRYPALNNQVGFVMVPTDMRDALIADGGAQDTFDYRSEINPAPPITALTFAPAAVVTTAPVGTNAGTLSAAGGTAPYVFTLPGNDGGNFAVSGTAVQTAKTPLTEGAHALTALVTDSLGRRKVQNITVTVTAPAAPQARKSVLRK